MDRVALDIKVINACGRRHCATGDGPEPDRAFERYANQAGQYQRTAELCAAQGIQYMPMVFSAQGGTSKASDGMVTRLAKLVESQEGVPEAEVRQFLQSCSLLLAQQAVRAHVRRCGRLSAPRMMPSFPADVFQAAAREHGDDHWQRDDESTDFGTDGAVDADMEAEDGGSWADS